MSGRNSSATDAALRDVARGMTMYAAAKKHGLAQSTVQRAVKRTAALPSKIPRFLVTFCSQCGAQFGPGDHGYSHCENHSQKEGKP